MKTRNFAVVIERDTDGWLVGSVAGLAGCHTQAQTVDELLVRIKEVIELCLEVSDEYPDLKFVGVQQLEITV